MDKVEQIQAEVLSLFKTKNEQYGNAFAKYGTIGVMIRMGEKINRFLSVSRLKIELKDEETLRDTLLDLLNYSSMAVMLLDDKKSKSSYLILGINYNFLINFLSSLDKEFNWDFNSADSFLLLENNNLIFNSVFLSLFSHINF